MLRTEILVLIDENDHSEEENRQKFQMVKHTEVTQHKTKDMSHTCLGR